MKEANIILCTASDAQTIERCVTSFSSIPCKKTVVVNNYDETYGSLCKRLEVSNGDTDFIFAKKVYDLAVARNLGLALNPRNVILRGDGDYIFHNSKIQEFMRLIKELNKMRLPTAISFRQVNKFEFDGQEYRSLNFPERKWQGSVFEKLTGRIGHFIPPEIDAPMYRLFNFGNILKFRTKGKRETISKLRLYRKVEEKEIYWDHVTTGSKMDLLERALRPYLRAKGVNFGDYALTQKETLRAVRSLYNSTIITLEEASELYWDQDVRPHLVPIE
ncbi:hypothetical protein N9W76_00735 [Planktomarina temperata]|nr:hypothetical protein [Planktomarina temperata]